MKYFEYKNIKVKFYSTGGIESCYILPDYKIAFDMGRCPPELIDVPTVFLSHGHLDHASGVSYYFSQRSLKNLGPGVIYVPQKILKPIRKIAKLWQKIEEFDYKSKFIGVKSGREIELQNDLRIIPVPARHRVSANGYVLIKKNRKLKKEFLGMQGSEIAKLKESKNLFEDVDQPIFAYSGDSTIEIISENPLMRNATVLFMECTYIDEKRSVERARKWGHTHLDEIIDKADIFQNEKIVLVHLSRRYTSGYIQAVMKKKLPASLQDRFVYVE